jgi:hypothetical protein
MIQRLLSFGKGLPWYGWVLIGLAILYLFNVASGSIYSRKLWNMLHDQILQEDKTIQKELEKEVTRLDQRERDLIQWSPTGRSVAPCSRPSGATSRPEMKWTSLPGENARIKKQLAAAKEEKRMLLGRLHEIESEAPLKDEASRQGIFFLHRAP